MTCQNSVPTSFRAGDTVQWVRSMPDYLPSSGWLLFYRFSSLAGIFDVSATTDSGQFRCAIDAATSAAIKPGTYTWAEYVKSGDGQRYTISTGQCAVLPDIAAASAGADLRSDAQRALDAITSKLAGRGGDGVDEYEIHGRKIKYTPLADLLTLKQHFQSIVNQEKAANGQRTQPRRVLLGFGGGCNGWN